MLIICLQPNFLEVFGLSLLLYLPNRNCFVLKLRLELGFLLTYDGEGGVAKI